jgi:CBS domain-containing protein
MRSVDYLTGKQDFKGLRAVQFMQQDVLFFSKKISAGRLAAGMTSGSFGSIPIVDDQLRPIGIVSEFDLLKAIRLGKELDNVTAEEIMTSPAVTVSEETLAEEIMKVLEDRHLIRVPVVNAGGQLTGVVARRDILQGYLKAQVEAKVWWM